MRGADHIGFTVTDLDRSVAFYEMLLGQPPLTRGLANQQSVEEIVGFAPIELDVAYFAIPGTEVMLELLEYRTPAGAAGSMETFTVGNAHLCLVVEDIEAEYERLGKEGVAFTHPTPSDITSGMYAGGRGCYFRDPDGITVELLQRPAAGDAA